MLLFRLKCVLSISLFVLLSGVIQYFKSMRISIHFWMVTIFFFTKDNVDFKLISLNVRGIRSATKRKALLLWLNKQKADVVFLQETYRTKEVEPVCNTQWKGKMFYSHGTNHSCGVLVRDDLEFKLNSSRTDDKAVLS